MAAKTGKLHSIKRTLPALVLAITLIGQVSSVTASNKSRIREFTRFTSRALRTTVGYGENVSLACTVGGAGEDTELTWWFIDYELQLTNGSQLLAHSENYQLHYTKGLDGNLSAILTIVSFQPFDNGYYRCQFSNDSGTYDQLNRLLSADHPEVDEEEESSEYEDMTDCCQAFGVTGRCLDLCSPFDLFQTGSHVPVLPRHKFKECKGQVLLALMECGSGRNNIPCCLERNVTGQCSSLCDGTFREGMDLEDCSAVLPDMALCFSRGLASIPPPVSKVHIKDVTHDHISIRWSIPPWSRDDEEGDTTDDDESLPMRFLIIQLDYGQGGVLKGYELAIVEGTIWNVSIKGNSMMRVSVVSTNQHGASSRVAGLELRLPPMGVSPSLTSITSPPLSLAGCCQEQGIPMECHSFLCGIRAKDIVANDSTDSSRGLDPCNCHRHVGKLKKCLAVSERDRRECCVRQRVSPQCLPLCEGSTIEPTLTSVSCLGEMKYIRNCLEDGKVSAFGRHELVTSRFIISDVTCCLAVFEWIPSMVEKTSLYVLRYREAGGGRYKDVASREARILVEGLKPGTEYEALEVIALEDRVEVSVNSLRFRTRLSQDLWIPKMSVTSSSRVSNQDAVGIEVNPPTPLIPIGQRVTMACFKQLLGSSAICHWVVNSLIVNKAVLEITSANEKSSGVYTCVCGKDHKSYTLNIQSAPTAIQREGVFEGISPVRVVRQPPASHLAELACYFLGFPDEVVWFKDGREVVIGPRISPDAALPSNLLSSPASSSASPSSTPKYTLTKYSLEDRGILYYKLTIEPFEASDTGSYRCVGSNRYASDEGTIYLTTEDAGDLPGLEAPKEHPASVLDCCRESNVTEKCVAACSFEVDLEKLLELSWECYCDFHKILQCSSRGWNYSACCKKANIPDDCQTLCQGGGVTSDDLACECINYADEILACHSSGHSFTPDPPSSVNLTTLPNGLLVIRPSEPLEGLDLVTGYYVNWTLQGQTDRVEGHRVISRGDELAFDKYQLEPFQTYSVTVQSYNRHSLSDPQVIADVEVKEPPIFEKLTFDLNVAQEGIGLMIRWGEVKYGHAERCIFDILDVGVENSSTREDAKEKGREKIVRAEGDPYGQREASVGGLEAGRWYLVTGRLRSANYEGPPSKAVRVRIPERSITPGVIVAVAVCLSVGTVIVAIAWVLLGVKFRRKKAPSRDSVTFESAPPLGAELDHQERIRILFPYHEFKEEEEEEEDNLYVERNKGDPCRW